MENSRGMINIIRDIWLCKTGNIRKIDQRIRMLQQEREIIVRYANIPAFYERLGRFVILTSRKISGSKSDNLNTRYYWRGVTLAELWISTSCVNWE